MRMHLILKRHTPRNVLVKTAEHLSKLISSPPCVRMSTVLSVWANKALSLFELVIKSSSVPWMSPTWFFARFNLRDKHSRTIFD